MGNSGATDLTTHLRALADARAASAARDWPTAAEHWRTVVAYNPVTGSYWLRLADAEYQHGRYSDAIVAYQRALELGTQGEVDESELGAGFPSDILYRIGCCHALQDEPETALVWLTRAIERGYRDLTHAQTDDALASLRAEPRFRDLVALPADAADPPTRDAGWRRDLRVVEREIRRKAPAPFRQIAEADFNAAVAALDAAIPDVSDLDVSLGLLRLVTLLGDGHAGVYADEEHPLALGAIDVQFEAFVEGTFITASAPELRELLGAQVLRIGDHALADVEAALAPLVPRDNEQWLQRVVPLRLRELPLLHALGVLDEPERANLTLRMRDGEQRTVNLVARGPGAVRRMARVRPWPEGWVALPETLPEPLPRYLRHAADTFWFELTPTGSCYVQLNGIADDPTESLLAFTERVFAFVDDHASQVARLVLDLRWNGGGNTFLELPLLHRLIGHRALNQRGKLFVIVGRRTFSAAQNLATLIERHTQAIFVGEPTGSSPNFVGETIPVQLPYSKLWCNISDLSWQSSWPMDHRVWIAPQLYAPPTFAAYRENRDPALEAIDACGDELLARLD
jgi:tetratricopeptide (TPR) repeat protein